MHSKLTWANYHIYIKNLKVQHVTHPCQYEPTSLHFEKNNDFKVNNY